MTPPSTANFRELLGRYERPLIHYADGFIHDVEAARDIVQETFLTYVKATTNPAEIDGPGTAGEAGSGKSPKTDTKPKSSVPTDTQHLEGWLFTVTRYRALDYARKHSRIIPMPLPHDEHCPQPGPAESAALRDDAAWLLALMEELPPNQQEVIRLKFLSELSYAEIAKVTGLSSGNVGFLLHTGLNKLRTIANERSGDNRQIRTLS